MGSRSFSKANKEENKAMFDRLFARKVEIEQILGTTLAWARGDDIKASKVSYVLNNVSITNETDWLMMAKFQAEWSKKMYDIFVPLIREMA